MPWNVFITQLAILLLILSLCIASYLRRNRNLPPGPRGIPIPLIENVLDMPTEHPWIHWGSYLDTYGPISSLRVMGKTVIILNSLDVCIDLLEKRSNVYSERPTLTFAGEMVGWNTQMILSPYGNRFRAIRKMVFRCGGSKSAVKSFQEAQILEMHYFLAKTAENPDDILRHLRRSIGAIYLRMSHGYRVNREESDPLVDVVEKAAYEFYLATKPGEWIVDLFPILKDIPQWVPPFLPFQSAARRFKDTLQRSLDVPHQFVIDQLKRGTALPSFTSQLLETVETEDEKHLIKYVSSTLYAAGLDTICATLGTFFLAMLIYPDVQEKVQSELDNVVGTSRLPNFDDRERLPYLAAVQKEVLRWHPVGPMGIPHMTNAEDVYHGYTIPKDAVVQANIWRISRDAALYRDPDVFRPERFLGANPEQDPYSFVFGFGRRSCPGQELAHATVYICIAMSLAVFNVTRPKDGNGMEIIPPADFLSGTVSHPKPFSCNVVPRSDDALRMINTMDMDLTADGGKLDMSVTYF
ncbi:cytochrome p450 [Moniliophthora roreri MCA 2997]|uniref:Cytochrome p450 n=1 Tax=Moniliophthora roreri (strain MCA 2997) TaxID=1381753 RepID=V2XR04_MONRO|nr:cytochrome p450 [Moniliophthora roreri MCA 2997]